MIRSFEDGEVIEYNADGQIIGGKRDVRDLNDEVIGNLERYTRTYNDDGTYTDFFVRDNKCYDDRGQLITKSVNYSRTYSADGKLLSGTNNKGESWTIEDNPKTGGFDIVYSDNLKLNYDKNGNRLSTQDGDTVTWTLSDNTFTSTNGRDQNFYNEKNIIIGGKTTNSENLDTSYVQHSGVNGERIYSEYTKSNGNKYFYYNSTNGSKSALTDVDSNGNILTTAIEGESFDATMARLGIIDAEDIDAFKRANPKAARKGYFLVGQQDVKIPKELADKLGDNLDFSKMMVNGDEQVQHWRNRRTQ